MIISVQWESHQYRQSDCTITTLFIYSKGEAKFEASPFAFLNHKRIFTGKKNRRTTMMYEWAKEMNCAVTVCDTQGVILYMNDKACNTFAKYDELIGKNLFDCHNPRSQEKIREMLETGGSNAYTIEKNGTQKMIYQTTWLNDGVIAGLVELSMELPGEIPHHIRK